MRISGGDARGIRLKVPPGTRPTSERVRQAVFSSLAAALPEARVLDLYCGSGAYGLEALSRGAESCVFVDRDEAALKAARANAAAAGLADRCRFRRRDVAAYLKATAKEVPFDLVFVDPPYADESALASALAGIRAATTAGSQVVVESRWTSKSAAEPAGYDLDADRRYGDTRVLVFRRRPDAGEEP